MLDPQAQEQLDRIERQQEEIKELLASLVDRGEAVGADVPVLTEASINDLARDFGKRGASALADHNQRRKRLRR